MDDNKDAYVRKLKAKIDEWNAEIDLLKARAKLAEAESRIKYQKQVEELKEHRDKAREKITDLQEAGEGAWKDLRVGVELAFESMSQALKSARKRFK